MSMSRRVVAACEGDTEFRTDVKDLVDLLTLPRKEYAAMGETGFFDTRSSFDFTDQLLNQTRKNIIYIVQEYFPHREDALTEPVDSCLEKYMGGNEGVSVTLHYKGFSSPIGIEVTDEFGELDKVATIQRARGGNEHAISEPDMKQFDRLYGEYIMGRSDDYGDSPNISLTLSVRNNKDYTDYGVRCGDYNTKVHEWPMPEDGSRLTSRVVRGFPLP